MSSVGMVIPCYNNFVVRPETISSIRDQTPTPIVQLVREAASLPQARNIGLARMDTDYYLPLDGDDVMFPGAVAALQAALDGHPECEIAYGDYVEQYIDENGAINNVKVVCPEWTRENMRLGNVTTYFIMFRRSLWERISGYDETMLDCDDWEFVARAMGHGACAIKLDYVTFTHLNRPGSMYQQTLANVSRDTILSRLAARVPEVFG